MPSAFPRFLEKTLTRTIDALSVETIRPLYNLLSTLGPCEIAGLPYDILSRLRDVLMNALKGLDVEHHIANLLCLAVIAKLAPRTVTDSPNENPLLLTARQFFAATRAGKTLDHITLKVILACSQNCPLTPDDAIESVMLSEEIVNAVESTERQTWIVKSTTKMKKLCEKMLRPDIAPELKCAALNFLARLSRDLRLPKDSLVAYESLLLSNRCPGLSPVALSVCIVQLKPCFIISIMRAVLETACDPKTPSLEALAEIKNSLQFVDAMIVSVTNLPSLWHDLLAQTQDNGFQNKLKKLAFPGPSHSRSAVLNDAYEVCPRKVARVQERLFERLRVLFLKVVLRSPQQRDADYLPVFDAIIDKGMESQAVAVSCEHSSDRRNNPSSLNISLFEANSTPETESISHGWKDHLVKLISRDANCHYESIIRMVGEVCRDLELRCDEVERPLHEERERSHKLRNRLETVEARVQELDTEAESQELALRSARDEKEQLCRQLHEAEECIQKLNTTLDGMKQESAHAEKEAERALEATLKSSRERDLAYIATLKSKDEMYERQASQLELTNANLISLQCDLDKSKVRDLEQEKALADKDAVIGTLQMQVAGAEATIASYQAEIGALKQTGQRLVAEREEVCSLAKQAAQKNAEVVAGLESDIQGAKDQIASVQKASETFASSKASEMDNLQDSHKLLVAQLRKEARDYRQNAIKAKMGSDSTITELKKTIARLRRDRDRSSKEFAEARDLSRRLMAVVGIQAPNSSPAKTAQQPDNRTSPQERKNDSGALHRTTSAFEFSIPNRSEEPTPKRTKTQSSPLSCHSQDTPTGTLLKFVGQSPCKGDRNALAEVITARNQRLASSTFACQSKKSLAPVSYSSGMLENTNTGNPSTSEDEGIDADDVFTSTDQCRSSVAKALGPDASFDETTAEL